MACLWRATLSVAGVAVALVFSASVSAQSPPRGAAERMRVELSLPDSCPQRERFFGQVRERLGADWEASPGELARTIQVSVSLDLGRYVARIQLTDGRGRQVLRAVAGAECESVIDSIALITVLAIQAQVDELIARSEPSPEAAVALQQPTATSPAANGSEAGQVSNTPSPERRPGPARSSLKLRVGGRAGLQQGIGPEPALLFGGFAALARERLALGLSLDVGGTGQVRADSVPVEFDLLAARLEVCARFRPASEALTIEPCGFFQGGRLVAQGARDLPRVSQGARGTTLWLAPGLLLAMRGELGPVFLGLELSGGIPLNRQSFYLTVAGTGRHVVYKIPWLTSGAALAAGVAF